MTKPSMVLKRTNESLGSLALFVDGAALPEQTLVEVISTPEDFTKVRVTFYSSPSLPDSIQIEGDNIT